MSDRDIDIQLPDNLQRQWHLAIDTTALSPDDIIERARQRAVEGFMQSVNARSVVVFESQGII